MSHVIHIVTHVCVWLAKPEFLGESSHTNQKKTTPYTVLDPRVYEYGVHAAFLQPGLVRVIFVQTVVLFGKLKTIE